MRRLREKKLNSSMRALSRARTASRGGLPGQYQVNGVEQQRADFPEPPGQHIRVKSFGVLDRNRLVAAALCCRREKAEHLIQSLRQQSRPASQTFIEKEQRLSE